jgi:predicted RNA methylase
MALIGLWALPALRFEFQSQKPSENRKTDHMLRLLFRWLWYFPYRYRSRMMARRLGALGVDFSTDADRRFPATIGYGYQPTYDAVFQDGIRHLPIPIREIKLLDAGCGKGPILYFAKKMGIQIVAGVELSDELFAIAAKNMKILGCHDVILFHKDITLLRDELDDYNVVYMFNPFPAEPMRAFMRAIAGSMRRTPRPVYVIYHNPVFADVCQEEGFTVQKEVLTKTYFGNDKLTLIFDLATTR